MAIALRIAEITARARVHRGDELHARRKVGLLRGPGYRDDAGFERFAQNLEHVAAELGQFVEEQHPVVRTRDFAGARARTAADHRGRRGRVMRRPERTQAPARHIDAVAEDRIDTGGLQRFPIGHRRQDAGKTARQHALARARGADEQQVVTAGRRDFQRPLGARLAAHVDEIGPLRGTRFRPDSRGGLDAAVSSQVSDDLQQRACRIHRASRQRRLVRVVLRHRQGIAGLARPECRRQHPGYGTQVPVQ